MVIKAFARRNAKYAHNSQIQQFANSYALQAQSPSTSCIVIHQHVARVVRIWWCGIFIVCSSRYPLILTWDRVKAVNIGVFPGEAGVQLRGGEVRLHRGPALPPVTGLHQGYRAHRPVSMRCLSETCNVSSENTCCQRPSLLCCLGQAGLCCQKVQTTWWAWDFQIPAGSVHQCHLKCFTLQCNKTQSFHTRVHLQGLLRQPGPGSPRWVRPGQAQV